MHTFNSSIWKPRQVEFCEFKSNLVYVMGSRTTNDVPIFLKGKKEKKNCTKIARKIITLLI